MPRGAVLLVAVAAALGCVARPPEPSGPPPATASSAVGKATPENAATSATPSAAAPRRAVFTPVAYHDDARTGLVLHDFGNNAVITGASVGLVVEQTVRAFEPAPGVAATSLAFGSYPEPIVVAEQRGSWDDGLGTVRLWRGGGWSLAKAAAEDLWILGGGLWTNDRLLMLTGTVGAEFAWAAGSGSLPLWPKGYCRARASEVLFASRRDGDAVALVQPCAGTDYVVQSVRWRGGIMVGPPAKLASPPGRFASASAVVFGGADDIQLFGAARAAGHPADDRQLVLRLEHDEWAIAETPGDRGRILAASRAQDGTLWLVVGEDDRLTVWRRTPGHGYVQEPLAIDLLGYPPTFLGATVSIWAPSAEQVWMTALEAGPDGRPVRAVVLERRMAPPAAVVEL